MYDDLNVFFAPWNPYIPIKIIKFEWIFTQLWSFIGLGGHLGGHFRRHFGFVSTIVHFNNVWWSLCVLCPLKLRNRHQIHQIWLYSYIVVIINRYWRPSWKKLSGGPIVVNFWYVLKKLLPYQVQLKYVLLQFFGGWSYFCFHILTLLFWRLASF